MDSQRPLTYAEYKEFSERMEAENGRLSDEDKRQNRRIDALEENVRQIGTLAMSVEKLAVNMESMLREQERQGERLKTLENRDGERWRQVTGYIITTAISAVLGYFFAHLGF